MSLIINADDFGKNIQINKAILLAFKKKLCSSATMIANMDGFNDAVRITHENGLRDFVGIHIVLTEGYPLTMGIKKFKKICNNEGKFCLSRYAWIYGFDKNEKRAIYNEIKEQIQKCRSNGLYLTHLDSHHHIHKRTDIIKIVIQIVKEEKIPYVRMSSSYGANFLSKCYSVYVNRLLRMNNLSRTNNFIMSNQIKFLNERMSMPDDCEIMVHPYIDNNNMLRDLPSGMPINMLLGNFNRNNLISFSGKTFGE